MWIGRIFSFYRNFYEFYRYFYIDRSWLLNDENLMMIVCKKGKFKLKVQRKILNYVQMASS